MTGPFRPRTFLPGLLNADVPVPHLEPEQQALAQPGNGPLAGYTSAYAFNLVNFDWVTWHNYEWQNWVQVDALLNTAVGFLQIRGIWRPLTVYSLGDMVYDPNNTADAWRCLVPHTSTTDFVADQPLYWEAVTKIGPPVSSVFGRIGNIVAQTGDYAAFYYNKTEADARYINTAGDTFTGPISWATAPTVGGHLTNKTYVDLLDSTQKSYIDAAISTVTSNANNRVHTAGDTMTGFLTLSADPTNPMHAATKSYVDSAVNYDANYDVKADIAARSIAWDKAAVNIAGFATAGDGGDALWVRVNSQPSHLGRVRSLDRYTASGGSVADATNGGWWELASIDRYNTTSFGTGATALTDAMAYTNIYGGVLYAPVGQITLTNYAEVPDTPGALPFHLRGAGINATTFKRGPANTNTGIGVGFRNNLTLSDFTLDMGGSGTSGHGIRITSNGVHIRDVLVKGFGYYPAGGGSGGAGIISLSPDSGVTKPKDIRLADLHLSGSASGQDQTFGWLMADTDYSFAHHILAENALGSTAYAHELKEDSRYNIMHALLTRNSQWGLVYGQSSEGVKGAKRNVAFGINSVNTDGGFAVGNADGNLTIGVLHDKEGAPGSTTGASVSINVSSTRNVVTDVLSIGEGSHPAVKFGDGSVNNYVSAAVMRDSASSLIELAGATSERNVINILHPGARNTIAGGTTDTTGKPVSGSTSNPRYSNATGEWIGTLSGNFLWQNASPGVSAFNSSQKFRFASDVNSVLACATNGTLNNTIAMTHVCPGEPNRGAIRHVLGATSAADAWYVAGFGGSNRYTFLLNAFRPEGADNVCALGNASQRWATVYAGTGTINTSDEQQKTAPSPIDDEVLDAWGDVSLVAFQWLTSIAEKGETARIHCGVIAQQIDRAFTARGLDAARYGFMCRDDDKWGIRPDQCLFIEAAYQRRRVDQIEERIAAMESTA